MDKIYFCEFFYYAIQYNEKVLLEELYVRLSAKYLSICVITELFCILISDSRYSLCNICCIYLICEFNRY